MYDEWISYWAKLRPDHVAVVLPNGTVGYADFDAQINKVAARLQALGIQPNKRVAVQQPNEYVHWLLLLALDRLGIASMSIDNPAIQQSILAALKPDFLLVAEGVQTTSVASLRIARQWLDETMAMPVAAHPQRRHEAKEIVRFFASSGTTGVPKLMPITRWQMAVRVDNARAAMAAGLQMRACTLLSMPTAGGYTWPLCYWLGGGSNIFNVAYSVSPAETLRRTMPNQLVLSVGTLRDLVRGPAADLPPMPSLEVFVVGSALPKVLAEEARRVLTPNVYVSYAASEVSGIGIGIGSPTLLQRHDSTAAFVFPGTTVEVVDEKNRPLPTGTVGILRVRTDGIIAGYLNEDRAEKATSPVRNGWFYPGDLGSLSADGIVAVAGRANDTINIGGDKFQPAAIEELALGCAGIRDAAAFSVPDEHGVETPWIAVVRSDDYKASEVLRAIKARWPLLAGLQVAVTQEIPRNHMGKIDRTRLRHQASAWKATAQRQ